MKKSIYVTGIVKDSKNNIEKYLFSENERLNAIIDELEEINENQLTDIFMLNVKINKAIEYIKNHINNCMFELRIEEMEELLEILGGEQDGL